MSSYIMHMCVSHIVKKRLKLTDKFIYGSILPDILKTLNNDRTGTHFLEDVVLNYEKMCLPNIQRAINELDKTDEEVKLGYIAHLIEDYIWFSNYIPTYAKKISQDEMVYLSDNTKHSNEEFRDDMYADYANSSDYVVDKCNVDIEQIKLNIENIVKDKEYIQIMNTNTRYSKKSDISSNKFMTKDNIDQYIRESSKEVEKVILTLIGAEYGKYSDT